VVGLQVGVVGNGLPGEFLSPGWLLPEQRTILDCHKDRWSLGVVQGLRHPCLRAVQVVASKIWVRSLSQGAANALRPQKHVYLPSRSPLMPMKSSAYHQGARTAQVAVGSCLYPTADPRCCLCVKIPLSMTLFWGQQCDILLEF
jgi:hypothetical protein